MTTTTPTTTPTTAATTGAAIGAAIGARAPARTASVPLRRVVRVELRKMFDTRSGFWLMASIVITSVLATGAIILFAPDDELTYTAFGTAIGFPMAVILPMIAILSVTSEWTQRSGLTTFTLVPHRGRVLLAKGVSAVGVGVVSMLLALAIGALGTVFALAPVLLLAWFAWWLWKRRRDRRAAPAPPA